MFLKNILKKNFLLKSPASKVTLFSSFVLKKLCIFLILTKNSIFLSFFSKYLVKTAKFCS